MEIHTIDTNSADPASHPEYFQGVVRMQVIYRPERDDEESEVVAVYFDRGARTRPHVHESTQILAVITGRCVVATSDERRIVDPGAFVVVPRGTWHWHGATSSEPMCHVSIKLPGRTDWDVAEGDWARG